MFSPFDQDGFEAALALFQECGLEVVFEDFIEGSSACFYVRIFDDPKEHLIFEAYATSRTVRAQHFILHGQMAMGLEGGRQLCWSEDGLSSDWPNMWSLSPAGEKCLKLDNFERFLRSFECGRRIYR